MKNLERGNYGNTEYEFNLDQMKLKVIHNGKEYEKELLNTTNEKLIQAFKENKVFLDTSKENLCCGKSLYFCSRSIMKTLSQGTEIYMDMLLYNDEQDILYPNALNRSQGHCNKKQQIEYHQVLKGEIISITTAPDGKSYYGFFKEGDYIHVPKGWFHCTYVVEAPAVVANFYCNTPWGDHVECKPYFEINNDFSFEFGQNEGEYILKKRGYEKAIIVTRQSHISDGELNLYDYETLEKIKMVRTSYPCENIFDYISQINLEEE